MGVTTWLDRITDESNLWLSAGKAEASKDYAGAATLYLRDATAYLNRGSRVRAALSCYCAAECVSMLGATSQADWLYSEAGRLYAKIADHGVSGSIREALWALQRAYACYVLAGNEPERNRVMEAYTFLVRRANPFATGSDWLEMPLVRQRRQVAGKPLVRLDPELERAVEAFFAIREPESSADEGRPMRPGRIRGLDDDQESFVSKLG